MRGGVANVFRQDSQKTLSCQVFRMALRRYCLGHVDPQAQARRHHRFGSSGAVRVHEDRAVRTARGQRHRHQQRQCCAGRRTRGQGADHRPVFIERRAVLRAARPSTTASSTGLHLWAPSRARCTCARWPRPTACRSSCTPTTLPRSCCPGSTACSTPARSSSRPTSEPLFSSHMLDLSEEPLHENLEICREYLDAHEQAGHDARDRAGRDRRRGRRRRQQRRRQQQALHAARRRAGCLRRAQPRRLRSRSPPRSATRTACTSRAT